MKQRTRTNFNVFNLPSSIFQFQMNKTFFLFPKFLSRPKICNFPRLCSTLPHNRFTYRTQDCSQMSPSLIGQQVTLYGWLQYRRVLGNIAFLTLRDAYGVVQVMVPSDSEFYSIARSLHYESVIRVEGVVKWRPEKDRNRRMLTGEVEIEAEKVDLINATPAMMPVQAKVGPSTESVKSKYRYLDLRRPAALEMLRLRSSITAQMRNCLLELGFLDIETPTLFRRTPGGAAEFIVPSSEQKGRFYCLPQSPQQFKQLLMVAGVDRYFQIARCYRDEGNRPDRQPEFTQLDIELSFVTERGVMEMVETVISRSWPDANPTLSQFHPKTPFPVITYADAMSKYGSDKPDTRFEMQLQDLTNQQLLPSQPFTDWLTAIDDPSVQCVVGQSAASDVTNTVQSDWKAKLADNPFAQPFSVLKKTETGFSGNLASKIPQENLEKLQEKLKLTPNDLVILSWGQKVKVQKSLGFLRAKLADSLEQKGHKIRSPGFNFVWVTEFPLFEKDDLSGKFESAHHPFTAPVPQDINLLLNGQFHKVTGQHYDLVLNGVELGGGSIRIHDPKIQKYVLEDVLGENCAEMSHLLEALSLGAPPHGGIALGMDRYLAVLLGYRSIKDVIAFPKSTGGRDVMSGAPTEVSESDLKRFGIELLGDKVE